MGRSVNDGTPAYLQISFLEGRVSELEGELKEAKEVLRWCKPVRDDIAKRRDALLEGSDG